MASLFDDEEEDYNNWVDHDEYEDEFSEPSHQHTIQHIECDIEDQSDEDAKLFIKKSERKELDGVIELAKKKIKRQTDIEERRKRRLIRIQEYYFCKAYFLIQIARSINIANRGFGVLKELLLSQVMSLCKDKQFQHFNLKSSALEERKGLNDKETANINNLEKVMKSFNEGLLNKLDHNKECVVRKDYQICAALANDEENNKLNFIEYLQIFNVFLKHLGYKTRFLCAFESKSLEEYGFLDVRRISKSKKNQQARFASLKAKLYNKNKRTTFELMKESGSINICPSFTKFVKMQENIEENEEIRCELRKIETSSKKTLDFLDKFAFNSSRSLDKSKNNLNKSNLTLSQSSARCTKRFVNKKSVLAKIPQSNLFVTSLDDALPDNEEIKCSDEISKEVNSEAIENNHIIKDLKEYFESDDEKENTKQKVKHKQTNGNELMKNLCCIEVLNTKTNKWIIVDLLNNTLIHSRLVISNWIEENSVLFLFAVGNFTFQKINGEISDKIYMKDVTLKYCSYFQQMLAIKNTLYLQDKIQKEIEILASFFNNACIDEELKKAMEYEEKEIYNLERYYIPEKYNGFRSHRHFVLESLLGKYQSLKPGVEPFNNMRFKNELIYLRSDVINLHTKEQWRRLRREVKPGERFIKKVKGNYNDKDKMALLYGAWQTEIFEIKLNKDGSLPSNDHGNIEVRSANDVPKGAQHLKIKKGRYICQKLGIQYREAMTGFETGGHGFSYPVIEGVIVLDKDVQTIMDEFNRMEEERIKREIKKRKSEAKDTWKMLIKKICVKRYTARLFEREPEDVAMDIPLSFK